MSYWELDELFNVVYCLNKVYFCTTALKTTRQKNMDMVYGENYGKKAAKYNTKLLTVLMCLHTCQQNEKLYKHYILPDKKTSFFPFLKCIIGSTKPKHKNNF